MSACHLPCLVFPQDLLCGGPAWNALPHTLPYQLPVSPIGPRTSSKPPSPVASWRQEVGMGSLWVCLPATPTTGKGLLRSQVIPPPHPGNSPTFITFYPGPILGDRHLEVVVGNPNLLGDTPPRHHYPTPVPHALFCLCAQTYYHPQPPYLPSQTPTGFMCIP